MLGKKIIIVIIKVALPPCIACIRSCTCPCCCWGWGATVRWYILHVQIMIIRSTILLRIKVPIVLLLRLIGVYLFIFKIAVALIFEIQVFIIVITVAIHHFLVVVIVIWVTWRPEYLAIILFRNSYFRFLLIGVGHDYSGRVIIRWWIINVRINKVLKVDALLLIRFIIIREEIHIFVNLVLRIIIVAIDDALLIFKRPR